MQRISHGSAIETSFIALALALSLQRIDYTSAIRASSIAFGLHYLCIIITDYMGINKLKVVLTEEAQAFLDAQPFKAQQKIYYNIFKVEEGVMKVDIFKKLENTEIWEFRTLYNGICYRLFSFWDTEQATLVIATHGIVKKTQKTPSKEIAKAEEIRKEYFNNKKK